MKDWKKAIGFFLIAVVAIVAGVFCLTLGSVPDWLSIVVSAIGGLCTALGIYWVNPLEKIVKGLSADDVPVLRCDKDTPKKSLLFGREIDHNYKL